MIRILDQWLKLCSLNKVPLGNLAKIEAEFNKRSLQAESKESKSKLDLSDCHLSNEHVSVSSFPSSIVPVTNVSSQLQLLCRVLVGNPKISTLDITHNPLITSTVSYSILLLVFIS